MIKTKIYSSYVRGNEWLNTQIDTKFIMCDKKNILNLTNIYENLDHYICNKDIPLSIIVYFFNSLLEYGSDMEMIMANPNDDYTGGWRWIRNNEMKNLMKNLKICILIIGRLDTFETCYESLYKYILETT
jgi:hypothetical protein